MRGAAGSSSAVLAAAFLGLLSFSGGPAAAQGGRSAPVGDGDAFAGAHSTAEIARAGRGLRPGERLHVEGLPLGSDGAPVGLDLVRFEVFALDGRVVVQGPDGEEERPFPAHAYFRGRVIGEPDSLALLTVPEAGPVRGLVRRDGVLWELTADASGPDGARRLAGRRVETPEGAEAPAFECATEGLVPPPEALPPAPDATGLEPAPAPAREAAAAPELIQTAATAYTARVAVETDFELFQRFGSQAAATAYVGDLFAYASSIYDREIGTNLLVSHLSLWTSSADPWSQTNVGCAFYEFGRYWNDHRAGVSRTLAHFVSGKSTSAGIAWIGVLCRNGFNVDLGGACPGLTPRIDNYGGAYGFTGGVRGNFNPATPSPVWDIVAVAHEIGHNFNSPHTHCYNGVGGSSSPVDECWNGQAVNGCYGGTQRLPGPAGAGSGTLMSYCHLLSPGMSNLSLTFGAGHPYGVLPQRVPDRMRAHVVATAASAPACLARDEGGGGGGGGGPCEDETLSGGTVNTTVTYEACGTLTAGDGFSVISPGNVTLRAGTVVLRSGFSVGRNARLRVESE